MVRFIRLNLSMTASSHRRTAWAGNRSYPQRPARSRLLDVMLPDLDGLGPADRREVSAVPVIMLTAKGGRRPCTRSGLGAKMAITKPFSPRAGQQGAGSIATDQISLHQHTWVDRGG
jgi:CheY-like chemotaxis protein